MARTKKIRQMMPEGICSSCKIEMAKVYDVRSTYMGGRRCRMYRCSCGLEIQWWFPSFRIEKGEYKISGAE
jgi:hypothetical protein